VNRNDKSGVVDHLRRDFSAARHAFLVDFQGLSVTHDTELRNRLRAAEVNYQVVKNRLARLALKETVLAGLEDQFRGPTGVALSSGDPVAAAKVLVAFAKDHPALKIKAGCLEGGQDLSAAQVEALSSLPSLPELRAQLLRVILTPATLLVRVLAEPGTRLARILDARGESAEAG
jgi:large subunit ribosomal protein L10